MSWSTAAPSPPGAAATSSWPRHPGPAGSSGSSLYRKTILAIAAGASTLALWGATGVDFIYNLLNLQAKGVESVRWEERILPRRAARGTPHSLPRAACRSSSASRGVRAPVQRVKVESLLLLYPDQQAEKTALIRTLAAPLASITLAAPPPASPAAIRAALETLRRRLGLAVDAAEGRADTAKGTCGAGAGRRRAR